MDPYLRRVSATVAVVLVALWAGMFAWALKGLLPDVSAPPPAPSSALLDLAGGLIVPGFHFSSFRVQAGDSYGSIAERSGIHETTLRSINQANDGSQPIPGDLLTVPSGDGIFHVVRRGQGLSDIARAYGIPLRQVLSANRKRGDQDVHTGDVLFLPGAPYLSRKDPNWVLLTSLEAKNGFLKPTTGRFADGFGDRIHPITHKKIFHEGLDLAPGLGARVVASQDGVVLFTGIRAGYGRLIILDHSNGLTSYYAHLDESLVQPRQKVKKGQLIGKVGRSGRVTGPHLHFEVRLNGKPQNPLLYLVQ